MPGPGFGGKPGPGRPKGGFNKDKEAFIALCRRNAPEAVDVILKLFKTSPDEKVKLAAAKEIVDRAWGKPFVTRDPDIDPNEVANETNVIKVRIINDPEETIE